VQILGIFFGKASLAKTRCINLLTGNTMLDMLKWRTAAVPLETHNHCFKGKTKQKNGKYKISLNRFFLREKAQRNEKKNGALLCCF
jgi:hypothetical protein